MFGSSTAGVDYFVPEALIFAVFFVAAHAHCNPTFFTVGKLNLYLSGVRLGFFGGFDSFQTHTSALGHIRSLSVAAGLGYFSSFVANFTSCHYGEYDTIITVSKSNFHFFSFQ